MEDNQLFNLAIPAPVLDGRAPFGDGVEPRRKYCTHGLNVPLRVTTNFKFCGDHNGGALTISYPETLERGPDP